MNTQTREYVNRQDNGMGAAMDTMTETQAAAAGLTTVIDPDSLPVRETPAEVAARASRLADLLAAGVELMREDEDQRTDANLATLSDRLGALHVEFDQLSEQLRAVTFARFAGVAS